MAGFLFTPDPVGIAETCKGPEMVEFINGRTDDALAAARAAAPVHTGDYRDSLGSTPAEVRADGVHGEFWSKSSFWHLVEYGTADNPAAHPLERGATAAGLRFTDDG